MDVEVDYGEKSISDYETNDFWRDRDCKRSFVSVGRFTNENVYPRFGRLLREQNDLLKCRVATFFISPYGLR